MNLYDHDDCPLGLLAPYWLLLRSLKLFLTAVSMYHKFFDLCDCFLWIQFPLRLFARSYMTMLTACQGMCYFYTFSRNPAHVSRNSVTIVTSYWKFNDLVDLIWCQEFCTFYQDRLPLLAFRNLFVSNVWQGWHLARRFVTIMTVSVIPWL